MFDLSACPCGVDKCCWSDLSARSPASSSFLIRLLSGTHWPSSHWPGPCSTSSNRRGMSGGLESLGKLVKSTSWARAAVGCPLFFPATNLPSLLRWWRLSSNFAFFLLRRMPIRIPRWQMGGCSGGSKVRRGRPTAGRRGGGAADREDWLWDEPQAAGEKIEEANQLIDEGVPLTLEQNAEIFQEVTLTSVAKARGEAEFRREVVLGLPSEVYVPQSFHDKTTDMERGADLLYRACGTGEAFTN